MDFTTDLRTLDHYPVMEGKFYWDYDFDLVRIEIGTLHKKLHVDFGAPESDAWFDVLRLTDGRQKLMNGPRLWLNDPSNGRSAAHVAHQRDLAVERIEGTAKCDAHWYGQQTVVPAVGDFRTHDGRWANLCDSHRRELTDGTAGLGKGQYFIYETH